MYRFRLSLLAALITTSVVSQTVLAAAFQLYEIGTPIIGTAGVGQAVANDASTAFLNPAGMGFLSDTEFMLGAQIILPYTNFSANSSTTISGDNGGNAGMMTPGMNMYYAYNYSPCLKFGISVASPYGGALNYNDGWVGRYNVQNTLFYTININPSIAYRFNRWFAIGAGASLEYMNLSQTTALPIIPLVDGQINVKTESFAPGVNIGLMFAPSETSKLGIAYRSRITHNLHGDLTFLRINATPNASLKMVMPHNIIASFSQDFANRFTLLAELGWSNWATMQNTALHVDNFTALTPLNWNNTYRAGLGGKFKATDALTFQAGVSYDSSPTNATHRLPVLPMDKQIRVGAGVMYSMLKAVNLAFSYEYWDLGSAHINNTSSSGVLAGSYSRNYANVVQASVNVGV